MKSFLQSILAMSVLAVGLPGAVAAGDDDAAPASSNELAVGDVVPEFISVDDHGSTWNSSDHLGKRVMVIYVYPGDFTSGCARQASAFRDNLKKLEELDVEVVGVSGDAVATHKLFKESHSLNHTLLSDSQGYLACVLGIPRERGARVRARNPEGEVILDESGKSIILERSITLPRWTLIIDRNGKVVSKRKQVDPATDADEVRRLIAELPRQ